MQDIIEEIQKANTPKALLEQIKQIRDLTILNESERNEIYKAILENANLDTVCLDLLVNIANSMGDMKKGRELYNNVLSAYARLIPGTEKNGLTYLVEAVKQLPQERIENRPVAFDLGQEVLSANVTFPVLIKALYEVKEIQNRTSASLMNSGNNLMAKASVLNALAKRQDTPPAILEDVLKEANQIEVQQTKTVILENLGIVSEKEVQADTIVNQPQQKKPSFLERVINSARLGNRSNGIG